MKQKPNSGKGKPTERAHCCLEGNEAWHKETNILTSPVTPQRAIRTAVAAAAILDWNIHPEYVLRAYLE